MNDITQNSVKNDIAGCHLCPRDCGARRSEGQKGVCGTAGEILIARAALHMWEEPCISGTKGSGTVFFSGCPLHCVYCQNREISHGRGRVISPKGLRDKFLELQKMGAHNINLVTPTHYSHLLPQVISEARSCGLSIPVVYNCSGYERVEELKKLEGFVDIYLTDFKYPDSRGAARYSGAGDYPSIAKNAIAEMFRQQSRPEFDGESLMQKGVIVRHLLLPGRVRPASEAVSYLYGTYGDGIFLSLMNQYTPFSGLCKSYPEIARQVTKREYNRLIEYTIELGVTNCFIQEGKTASESFIPAFDTGDPDAGPTS